jgi:hypothetical protein
MVVGEDRLDNRACFKVKAEKSVKGEPMSGQSILKSRQVSI